MTWRRRGSPDGIDTPWGANYLRSMKKLEIHRAARPSRRRRGGLVRAFMALLPGMTAPVGLVVPLAMATPLAAQITLPEDRGVVAAGLLLRQLDGEKRVLMIGAHPDDEDTSLLAALARGMGAQTAYLSHTRGEGGQNLIGPELDEGLGIIRTGELEAARRLDGGRQFFTRAFDFGFSKTAEETFGYWPREELLRDVVEVIRRFRPQVVVSVFSGTPRDGHGHHQVSGMISSEAFEAAGDPSRFPDQVADGLPAWQPSKLYQRFRGLPGGESLPVAVGGYDPLLGRSHFQLAMDSRSQHRSQDMGAGQSLGPRQSSVSLVVLAPGVEERGEGIFAGVDTTLVGMTRDLPTGTADVVRSHLERYRERVGVATGSLDALDPGRAAAPLAAALSELREARLLLDDMGGRELAAGLARREALTLEALLAAASVVVDVRTDREVVVPGEEMTVELSLWNGGEFALENLEGMLRLPPGWDLEPLEEVQPAPTGMEGFFPVPTGIATGPALEPGEMRRWSWTVTVPVQQPPSRLYYLEEEREGEMYRWPAHREVRGLSRNLPLAEGRVAFTLRRAAPGPSSPAAGMTGRDPLVEGVAASTQAPVRFVGVDKALGEFSRPLLVLPALSVATEPRVLAWPTDAVEDARTVTVRVRSQSSGPMEGTVALEVPPGWGVQPAAADVAWPGSGSEVTVAFQLRRPGPGIHAAGMDQVHFQAVARTQEGAEFREGFATLDYPHIERTPLFRPARVLVPVFPVQVAPGLRVAYVQGSGDDGPDALRQMGAAVEVITPERVAGGALDDFDTVVLGVRVYEVVPAMMGANNALLDFARRGGTVVVQYNKYEYPEGNLAPYPVRMARPHDRVTDEAAEVTFLDPGSPVFHTPNRITSDDFEGWVQERGLYFLNEWADPFIPLLEMADPGEAPKRGSLVVAPVGEGLYVYTGLAFFRQFPEGVPGAYRLFANLVSLEAGAWRAHHGPGDPGGER